jgi:hypothetical protein
VDADCSISPGQAGHSRGHSTWGYSALLERTGWTAYLT